MVKYILYAISLLITTLNSKLIVHSPESLAALFPPPENGNKDAWGVIPASYANFGFVPYGHAMMGRLFFDKSHDTLCEPLPEQEFQSQNFAFENIFTVPFMVADRGSCSFAKKVKNMEDAGVAVGIVVDNTEENINDIVMSDDGTGAGLRIPSLLISKKDGEKLINWLKNATDEELAQVMVLADFKMKAPDNRVEYDIWYSSSIDLALDFIQDFMKLDREFGKQVLMTPRFVFWECQDCDKEYMEQNCFAGGKYCATDQKAGLTGKEIVMEDLRQMCIYKEAYAPGGTRQTFWDYVHTVHMNCNSKINEVCSKTYGHKLVKALDWDRTQKCVEASFSTQDKSKWDDLSTTNTLIDKDIDYWSKYGTSLFPSIVINNSTYRGQLETQAVFNAICAGFQDAPRICHQILNTWDIENNIEVGIVYMDDGYRMKHVIGICLVFVVVLIFALCFYRRHAKREMRRTLNTQIETAVNHYVSLSQRDESVDKRNQA